MISTGLVVCTGAADGRRSTDHVLSSEDPTSKLNDTVAQALWGMSYIGGHMFFTTEMDALLKVWAMEGTPLTVMIVTDHRPG